MQRDASVDCVKCHGSCIRIIIARFVVGCREIPLLLFWVHTIFSAAAPHLFFKVLILCWHTSYSTRRQGRILEHFKLPSAARLHRLSAPFLAFQLQCHSSIILSFIYLNIPFFIARRPSQQGCVIPMSHF